MVTEGRGIIPRLQKDLEEAQTKLKTLRDLPKDVEALSKRVDEIQAMGQSVKDHEVVLKDLTERVGRSGALPKRGVDWKAYAIGILAVALLVMIIIGFNWRSQMVSSQDFSSWQEQMNSYVQGSVKTANDAITANTKLINDKIAEINAILSKLGR